MILLAACTSTEGTGEDPTPSSQLACALQDDNALRVVVLDPQGAFPLPDGGMFATCSTSSTGYEFAADSGDVPSFTIHAECGGMGGMGPGRIVPLSLPSGI